MTGLQVSPNVLKDLVWMKRQILYNMNQIKQLLSQRHARSEKEIRAGRTVAVNATYPANGTVYEVELGSLTFPETVGEQSWTFEAYDPQQLRFAISGNGRKFAEGTIVFVMLFGGQYFILPFAPCLPTTFFTGDFQVVNNVLQFKKFDTATCTETWVDVLNGQPCTEPTP